jgi:hypothetical protein
LLSHLRECHDCQRRFFALARIDRLLRERGERMRRKRSRTWYAGFAAAVAAVVVAVTIALPRSHATAFTFALKGVDGSIVARAEINPADAENQSISFLAQGLPTTADDTYSLWTASPQTKRPLLVGRFMISHAGVCRARFNLAGTRHPSRFWITPATDPSVVVAAT